MEKSDGYDQGKKNYKYDEDVILELHSRKTNDNLFIAGITLEILNKKLGIEASSLDAYLPMTTDQLKESEIKCITWSYFHSGILKEIIILLKKLRKFSVVKRKNTWNLSEALSLDDKLDDLHYYTAYTKFGVGRAHYDASQETRSGDLDGRSWAIN